MCQIDLKFFVGTPEAMNSISYEFKKNHLIFTMILNFRREPVRPGMRRLCICEFSLSNLP